MFRSYDGERDKKLDAMNNTAARGITLQEHLLGQWAFVEAHAAVRKAGEVMINSIDTGGYLRTPLEQIQAESTKVPLTLEDLQAAVKLVQTLEPPGVGRASLQRMLAAPARCDRAGWGDGARDTILIWSARWFASISKICR